MERDLFVDSDTDESLAEDGDVEIIAEGPSAASRDLDFIVTAPTTASYEHLPDRPVENEPIHIDDDDTDSIELQGGSDVGSENEVEIVEQTASTNSSPQREETQDASDDVTANEGTAVQTTLNASLDDFKSPRKYKIRVKDKKDEVLNESVDDEAECCPICFERWENSGNHRLASLKCGHLFGQSCINKWLEGQGGKCPQCNAKASKKDIRLIYAKTLKMLDTTERDRAMSDLEQERKLRQKAELETAQLRLNYQMALDECKRLRDEVERHKSTLDVMRIQSTSSPSSPSKMTTSQRVTASSSRSFVLEKTVKVSDNGNCRVMAHCSYLSTLCISQPSSSPLFPGFGVKKLSTVDFKTSQYVAVHSRQIRDLVFSSNNAVMLSASVDKSVKLTSLSSNSVVQTYNLPVPVWSCAYNSHDHNYLYAGLLNGSVAVFDMRNTSESVKMLNTDGSKSPVVALHYIPADNRSLQSRMSGLLVGQLDRCSFYEFQSDDYKPHLLPIDGSLCSLAVDIPTRHALLTYRPGARQPSVRHQMSAISSRQLGGTSLCTLQSVHTFHGGSTQKLLSRNQLVPHPEQQGNLLVCACDEASSSVHVWEATTGAVRQRLTSTQPLMDVCHVAAQDKYYLCSLSEKQLYLYSWR